LTTEPHNLEQLETDLWAAADNLRPNSKLTSSEYCMPVLGVIFLRHATNRYDDAVRQIEADQAAGTMPKRLLVKGDFLKRRALQLPPEARYDTLLGLPTGASLGTAIVKAIQVHRTLPAAVDRRQGVRQRPARCAARGMLQLGCMRILLNRL